MAHKGHTKIALGTRPFIEAGVDEVAHARSLFLHQMLEYAPLVLVRLDRDVLPLVGSKQFESALKSWATRCDLTVSGNLPPWIPATATVEWWKEQPEWAGKLWLMVGESLPLGVGEETQQRVNAIIDARLKQILEARRAKRPEPPLLVPGYRGFEGEGKWEEPPKSYKRRMRKDAESAGFVRVPTSTLEHFQWACRFQCAGERIIDIADDAKVHRRDVEKAINHVLRLIGLDRRKERHGPSTDDLKNW
jgi:hypothetical protein